MKSALYKKCTASIRNHRSKNYTKYNDIIIRYKKINYREEYNKSHKMLKIFKATNDVDSMKDELAKLWSYYLIIEEIYVQKGKNDPSLKATKEYKDAIIAKAFILGDIKEYLTYVENNDKKFNFVKYYEESPYNKDVIIITQNDIKTISKIIKQFL